MEDPEAQFKRNKYIQFRNSKSFVPYLHERDNCGYIQHTPLNPLKETKKDEVWKSLDMTL